MNSFALYRRMLAYVRPHWHLVVFSIILSLLVICFEALSLWFGASLIQTLFKPEDITLVRPEFSWGTINEFLKYWTYQIIKRDSVLDSLKLVCGMMALTFLFKNGLIYLKTLVMAKLKLLVVKDMRNDLYGHILKMPVSYYDQNKTGSTISLIVNDIANINHSMTGTFDKLLTEPMRVLFFIGMLFIINIRLSLAVFIIFPILGFLIAQIGRVVRRRSKKVLECMAGMLSILHETIGGIRAVKMFSMNEHEEKRFQKENESFIRSSFRSTKIGSVSSPLTEVLGVIVVIILLWYGGRQVLMSGGFGAEDFIRFLIFLFSTFAPLKQITTLNNTLQRGFAAADRVFKVLDLPHEPLVAVTPENIPDFTNEITYSHVHFTYPGCSDEVLHDINFTLKKGSVVALVGSSGGGKSTILDLLPRFYDVSRGTVYIDGVDIQTMDLTGLRHLFGIVSQETILFNDTVINNIGYGIPNINENDVNGAATAANALEFINKLPQGMNTIIGEKGVMLSGGQRQRISIARALLRNPPILILDEATSALDTESERHVQNAINTLIEHRTALVVAHRLSTIQHADAILVIEDGRIVEQGNHKELLAQNKRYRYFYDIQFSSPTSQ